MAIRVTPLLAAGCAVTLPAVASAQQTTSTTTAARAGDTTPAPAGSNASNAANSGEIIVTAQKRAESINTVPLSITAASGDQLISRGIVEAADLVRIVPGFQATTSIAGTPVFYLRGIGFDDISAVSRPTVTLYSDEAPLPYSAMALGNTLDLERVEVLKGPQGLLFGSNSTGGAINFIAAKPTNELHFGADASLGRFMERRATGFISGPLNDSVSARLAVGHDGMNRWQYDYLDGKKNGKRDVWSGRATVDLHPGDRLRARMTLFGARDRSDTISAQFVGFDPAVARPEVRAYPIAPRNNRATSFVNVPVTNISPAPDIPVRRNNYTWQATLRADYDLTDDVTLTSLTNLARNRQRSTNNSDGMQLLVRQTGIHATIKTFTQEVRLSGNAGAARWIVGGNYEDDRTIENTGVIFPDSYIGRSPPPPFPPFFVSASRNRQKFKSYAAFGNVDYDIGDRFTVHAGARYTHMRTDFAGCTLQVDPTNILFVIPAPYRQLGACATKDAATQIPGLFEDSLTEHNVSWRAGLDFKPAPGLLFYGSVSRGYKAGAYGAASALFKQQLFPAVQEKVTAYEVGFKGDLVRQVLHVNGALFYYDYADKQLQGTFIDVQFGPLQRLINIPKSRVQGAELEVTLRPVTGLSLNASATYVDTKVTTDFQNVDRFGMTRNFKGAFFPNTPKWQTSANVEYRQPLTGTVNGFVSASDTYRSGTYGDFFPNQRLRIKGYNLVDAQIGIEAEDGRWRAAIYGRNIFNTYYWTTQGKTLDAIVRYTGMPATYGVQVSTRF